MAKQVKTDNWLYYRGLGNQINGDNVVGMVAPTSVKGISGYGDTTNVLTYLTSDDDKEGAKKYLGLIELFSATSDVEVPIHMELVKDKHVVDVDPEGAITYDISIPQVTDNRAEIVGEVHNESLYPGQPIRIVFDRQFTAGDRLKPDLMSTYQVKVSEDHQVVPNGSGWEHVVFYDSKNNRPFPQAALKTGRKWQKVSHHMAEYSTQWSNVSMGMSKPGVLNMEAYLPSPQGIEMAYTLRGGNIRSAAAEDARKQTSERLMAELDALGGFEKAGVMFTGKETGKGGVKVSRIANTLEYLAMKELFLMNSYSNMFSIAVEDHTNDGVIRINEGVWFQSRRGKVITVSRPGGLTVNHLKEASNYLYGNAGIAADERVLIFEGGWNFYNNGLRLINDYALSTITRLSPLMGTDGLIKSPLTGANDNLELGTVKVQTAIIEGVGKVYFKHDKSFDYRPVASGVEDDFVTGGYNKTSYSGILNAYDSVAAGRKAKLGTGAKLVNGGNLASNFLYLKPDDGTHFFYGHTLGRAPFNGVSTDLKASLRYMGHEFFASMRSWIMMVDTTAHVIIELADTYEY